MASWFSKNWKWVLPSGCLLMIVLFIGLIMGGAFYGINKIMDAVDNFEPLEEAKSRAAEHPEVILHLGTPLESSGMFQGKVNISNNSGSIDAQIPVKGPEGHGTFFIVGKKNNGVWSYSTMQIQIEEGDSVKELNLLNP